MGKKKKMVVHLYIYYVSKICISINLFLFDSQSEDEEYKLIMGIIKFKDEEYKL